MFFFEMAKEHVLIAKVLAKDYVYMQVYSAYFCLI